MEVGASKGNVMPKARAMKLNSPAASLSAMTNTEIVTLALYSLGGDQQRVDTEDVAVRANELAPGRYTWIKYPDQISIEHVRVFLSDAKKEKNGRWVAGNGSEGWSLTTTGIIWATNKVEVLGSKAQARKRLDKVSESRRRQELGRIKDLPAWTKYVQREPIARRDAETVFRVSSYSHEGRRQELIERMRALFVLDEEMSKFLAYMVMVLDRNGESL